MKLRIVGALVCAWALLMGCPAEAQTKYKTPEGDWWTVFSKGEQGMGRLTVPANSTTGSGFRIFGAGYFYKPDAVFFQIPEDTAQVLNFDPKGSIFGLLQLYNEDGTSIIGTLTVTDGYFGPKYEAFQMNGILVVGGTNRGKVMLKGKRMIENETVLTGMTIIGTAKGNGISSSHVGIDVIENSGLSFPFFTVNISGFALIDGELRDLTNCSAELIVNPWLIKNTGNNAAGTFTPSPSLETLIGPGSVTANLSVQQLGPRVRLTVQTATRRFDLKGRLTIPNSPILSVSPSSMEFGEVTFGQTKDLEFTVTNTGVGSLSGIATLTNTKEQGFTLYLADTDQEVRSVEYTDLVPGDEAKLTVRFKPEAGSPPVDTRVYEGSVKFTGGGTATAKLKGTGKKATTSTP